MALLHIKIPKETSRLISNIDVEGEKEDSAERHITILFLGDDFPIKDLGKALEVTAEVLEDIKPFKIKIDHYECFAKGDDGVPVICPIKSDDLHELHEKLAKAFDDNDLEYSKKWKEYRPHTTLSYNDKKIDKKDFEPIEWIVHEITLWGGNNGENGVFITFPLGIEKSSANNLFNMCDLYLRICKS